MLIEPTPGVVARFRSKFTQTDGCWTWNKPYGNGYGYFHANGKDYKATRVIFEWVHGITLDPQVEICHTCDNTACVRPSHLFEGTHKQNMEDMAAKGRAAWRGAFGEAAAKTKITWDDVREIRRAYRAGEMNQGDIVRKYQISGVSQILHNETWFDPEYAHQEPATRAPRKKYEIKQQRAKKYSAERVEEIRALCAKSNRSQRSIAKELGISRDVLRSILKEEYMSNSGLREDV